MRPTVRPITTDIDILRASHQRIERARHDMFKLLILLLPFAFALSDPSTSTTLHIALLPSAAPPTPFLDILYTPSSDSASVLKTHILPDSSSSSPDSLLRLGLSRPDLESQSWSSISIPPSSLSPTQDRTLTLLVSRSGVPYHLIWSSSPPNATVPTPPPKSSKQQHQIPPSQSDASKGALNIVVRRVQPGPKPVLNKPVVLNEQGKVAGQPGAEEDNRSFLQKYWWMIAAFLVLQLVVGGGSGDK